MERKRFSLELSEGLLKKIDQFKREWGLRSRGAIVERLLEGLLTTEESEDLYADDIYSEDIVGQEKGSEKSKYIHFYFLFTLLYFTLLYFTLLYFYFIF